MSQLTPPRISALIAVLVLLWLASGQFGSKDGVTEPAASQEATPLPRVVVRHSNAEEVTRNLRLTGRTAPNREATLAAEVAGRIVSVDAQRGEFVEAGAVIARIDMRWRQELLAEAEALVQQREIEYQAAIELAEKGFRAESQKAAALAALETARAQLKTRHLEVEATTIRAPFGGVLHERFLEVGDYVKEGDAVAELVDVDPFIVIADVAETDIGQLRFGQSGVAALVDGRNLEGRLRYIGAKADEDTRTYRIELEVENPTHAVATGMSADMLLPLETVVAHRLSPSLLSLDSDGNPGVKTVDEDGVVRFHAIRLSDVSGQELLATGLDTQVDVITTGQGFVRPGDRVDPVPEQQIARLEAETEYP